MSAQPQNSRQSTAFETATLKESPVRMKIKQCASDDDRGTIMVLSNDPFQSLTPPERRAPCRECACAELYAARDARYRWSAPSAN